MDNTELTIAEEISQFIDLIARDRVSLESLDKGLALLSKPLHIGRISGEMMQIKDANEKRLLDNNRVLFLSDEGYDPLECYSEKFMTNAAGEGMYLVNPLPGHKFTDKEKELISTVLKITDIQISRVFAISQVAERSMIQMLTGLPNASGYMRVIRRKYKDNTITNYDSYYFNLKNFSLVNKRFGQQEGNNIIRRYAETVNGLFLPDEVLGHLGGDNFVALVRKGERSQEFRKHIASVEAYGLSGNQQIPFRIEAAAGYMPIDESCEPNRIIGGPSIALAHAKRTKQNFVELTKKLNDEALRIKSIEQRFEKALLNKEFVVYYQPKVNSVSGEIIGAEALSRWIQNGEVVPPDSFIPALEQVNKLVYLDLYVLRQVCHDISVWQSKGRTPVPCSLNFSRTDITDPQLPDKIMATINEFDVDKKNVVIEITETASEEEKENMELFLNKMKNYGIVTSIDDFGTGYSSLSTLRDYPVNEIKIDRSFINRDIDDNVIVIIKSIIDMARRLNIDVITEGVEYREQKDLLHELGCDRIQGFLYDKPLPREEFETRLLKGHY